MVDKLQVRGRGGGSGGDVEPDTLFTNSTGKGIYVFSEGPVEGLVTGDGKSIYLDDVPLLDSNGVTSAKGVSWTWRDGLPDQTYIDGFPAAVAFENVGVEVTQSTPHAVTIANGADNYDAAYVVVAIPVLQFRSAKGNLRKQNVGYQIQVKANGGSWVTQHSVNFTEKSSSQWEGTYRVELPAGGSPWEVRVNRTTTDSDTAPATDGSYHQSQTYFARYATITDGKFTYRNTAVLGIQFDAKQYGSNIPSVKARIKGIKCYIPKNYDPVARTYATTGTGTSGGIWDGSFKVAYTNNPVWIYHDLIINNRYGLGQDFNPTNDPESAFVDKWALYSLSQYADESVDNGSGGTEPRFTINAQITNKQEAYDLLTNIISTMNGMLYFSAEKVVAVADRPQTVSDVFTQADVEQGFFEYSGTALKTRHSVAIVNYKDPNNLFKSSNVIYEDTDYLYEIGHRITELTAFGCTSRAQAMRLAKWTLRTERSQTQTVTFKTGHRGGLLKPGNVIKIFDDYKTGTRMGGRMLSYATTTTKDITLDSSVTYASGDTFMYFTEAGALQTYTLTSSGTSNVIPIATGQPNPLVGSTWALVKPSLDGQLFRVLVVEEDQDDGKYIVSALQHDATKFDFVDEDIVLEAPVTSVLTADAPSPVLTGTSSKHYEATSGTQVAPKVTLSWNKPVFSNTYSVVAKRGQLDDRIVEFELELATPWEGYRQVYRGSKTSWTSPTLEIDDTNAYAARVRSVDQIGRVSAWYDFTAFSVEGKTTAPPAPTNITATPVLNGIALSWDNAPITDFKHTEVWASTTNTFGTAVKLAEVSDDFYIINDIEDNATRYFWLRTISHNPTLNQSTYVTTSGVRKAVSASDTNFMLSGPTLPGSGTPGQLFFNTTDGKLYRYFSGAWTVAVPTTDLTGTINTTQIANNAITTAKFASGITPVEVVSVLPTTGNFAGRTVVLTTDGKLYRYSGSAFTAAVPTTDLSGTIAAGQIAANAVTSGTIAAGAIFGSHIAANTINAGKLVVADTSNMLLDSNCADVTSWNGTVTFATTATTQAIASSNQMQVTLTGASGYVATNLSKQARVEVGKKYYIRMAVWGNVVADCRAYIGTANNSAATTIVLGSSTSTGSITYIEGIVTIPSGYASLGVILVFPAATGTVNFGGVVIRRATEAELIVDGSITANKIAANTITASQIAAGTITATQIASATITGDRLVAGTITASQIASATITGDRLVAGTITATQLGASSVTAAKIAAGAITADIIAAGTIGVSVNVGSSSKILLDGGNNRIIISD